MANLNYNDARHATWLELFFDLIFVVLFGSIINTMNVVDGPYICTVEIMNFAMAMIPIWWIWANHTIYSNMYDDAGNLHRIITLLMMFFIIILSRSVSIRSDIEFNRFIEIYFLIRVLQSILYFASINKYKEKRAYTVNIAKVCLADAFIGLIPILINRTAGIILFFASIAGDIFLPALLNRKHVGIIIDKKHYLERAGLMAIIIMGEGVIFIVENLYEESISMHSLMTTVVGFIFITGLWWYYFTDFEQLEEHAKIHTHYLITIPQLFLYIGIAVIVTMINFAYTEELDIETYKLMCIIGSLLIVAGKETIYIFMPNGYVKHIIEINIIALGVTGLFMFSDSYLMVLIGLSAGVYTYNFLAQRRGKIKY